MPNRFGKLKLLTLKSKENQFDDAFDSYIDNDIDKAYDRAKLLFQIKETKRQNIINMILVFITLIMAVTSCVSVYFAFIQPERDKKIAGEIEKQNKILSLYREINANEDIFISNVNNSNNFYTSTKEIDLPFNYITENLDLGIQDELQKSIGLINYRFLLHQIELTNTLNERISSIKNNFYNKNINIKNENSYKNLMDYLSIESWKETKFNYLKDSGCILAILQKTYPYIKDERNKQIVCETDSLNRIYYHFGYLPIDTPTWMKPLLRDAVKSRKDIQKRKDIDWDGLFSM
ncbi:MAG: hypothetical protein ACD_72C00396G0005 [uncultured bacterium]|nr:MAG: hypothetical protein ACD_72C00396G0005 [uncultured bacterium]